MNMAAPDWLVALEASGLGGAIRQSVWIYPAANIGHVVAVMAFAGAVTVLDLALMGIIRGDGRLGLALAARRWAVAFLIAIAATGAVLFIAEASHVALNRAFQIKMLLVALGILNALFLGSRGIDALALLADQSARSAAARGAALASLGIWLAVAALGRYIAYH
jgi:hypothetical protein